MMSAARGARSRPVPTWRGLVRTVRSSCRYDAPVGTCSSAGPLLGGTSSVIVWAITKWLTTNERYRTGWVAVKTYTLRACDESPAGRSVGDPCTRLPLATHPYA